MLVEPAYASEIVAVVVFRNTWTWYVSNYTYWALDWMKFLNAGLPPSATPKSLEEVGRGRFNIPVVNEDTAEQFLIAMAPYHVSVEELRDFVAEEIEFDEVHWQHSYPSVLVDFDQRRLVSNYPESDIHMHYAPEGWGVETGWIIDEVPPEYRYWIIDGKDVFADMRGKSKLQAAQA